MLDLAGRAVRPGITADEIDRIVHEACIERGASPKAPNRNVGMGRSCLNLAGPLRRSVGRAPVTALHRLLSIAAELPGVPQVSLHVCEATREGERESGDVGQGFALGIFGSKP